MLATYLYGNTPILGFNTKVRLALWAIMCKAVRINYLLFVFDTNISVVFDDYLFLKMVLFKAWFKDHTKFPPPLLIASFKDEATSSGSLIMNWFSRSIWTSALWSEDCPWLPRYCRDMVISSTTFQICFSKNYSWTFFVFFKNFSLLFFLFVDKMKIS